MRYDQVDPILTPWAMTHGLFVVTQFKDCEVRSIQIVDDAGDSYQLSVDVLRDDGALSVSIYDPAAPRRSQTFATSIAELGATLESAYATAESWMRDKGHSRTAV
jgi:hypothetical protein